jgi:hypothetical protein
MTAREQIVTTLEDLPSMRGVPDASALLPKFGIAHRRRQGPLCLEGEIPAFVERALDRLHGSVYSCALRARMEGRTRGVSSYVYLREGEPHAVLLYRISARTLEVVNEVFTIDAHNIAVFAEHMLQRYRHVAVIRMRSIETDLALLRMPMLKVAAGSDTVVELAADRQSCWNSLDKTTRQNIKYFRNKLLQEKGEFSLLVQEGRDITRAAFDEVLALHCAGTTVQHAGPDDRRDDDLEQRWQFTRQAGLVLRLSVDGRVSAGAICLRAGTNWHLVTLAHDSALNAYRLGTLCCYLAMEECIKRGGREFHFLGGQCEGMYRFLGRERKLYDLTIYRSRSRLALQPLAALEVWSQLVHKRAKEWLAGRKRPASF